jgi:hypothetical protein
VKLTAEQARELTWGISNPELGLTVESNEQIDSRRWVSVHMLVLRDKAGKLWAAYYEQGLTEMQDIMPFEDMEEVHFFPVEQRVKTTYVYVKADQ